MKASDTVITPIHREGHFFVALFFALSLILFWLWAPLGWVGLVATAWCLYFFRDPERVVPQRGGILVSPGDGVVSSIGTARPPAELGYGDDEERRRISVFLNVFNVHVNRSPEAGTVAAMVYVPGRFVNAADDTASDRNERQLVRLTTEDGPDIAFAQVAGLVARRILCDLSPGQKVARGERFGIIRFGSRVDIYLDPAYDILVAPGQSMIGGETVLAAVKW